LAKADEREPVPSAVTAQDWLPVRQLSTERI
jgi:hypothetical protein